MHGHDRDYDRDEPFPQTQLLIEQLKRVGNDPELLDELGTLIGFTYCDRCGEPFGEYDQVAHRSCA